MTDTRLEDRDALGDRQRRGLNGPRAVRAILSR
jgi:hypothetical protein